MKKTNRQLILGSLQPLLFCIGMYFVVLIFSVFICTSLYRVMKTKKTSISMDQKSKDVNTNTTTAMVTVFK
ncbi:MAG: hypothetical protein ACRC2O_17960 [Chitinophagaceae bacterium]